MIGGAEIGQNKEIFSEKTVASEFGSPIRKGKNARKRGNGNVYAIGVLCASERDAFDSGA